MNDVLNLPRGRNKPLAVSGAQYLSAALTGPVREIRHGSTLGVHCSEEVGEDEDRIDSMIMALRILFPDGKGKIKWSGMVVMVSRRYEAVSGRAAHAQS